MNSFSSTSSPISTPPTFYSSSYASPSPLLSPSPSITTTTTTTSSFSSFSSSSSSSPFPSFASTTTATPISAHENLKEGMQTVLSAYSTTLKQLMDALAIAAKQSQAQVQQGQGQGQGQGGGGGEASHAMTNHVFLKLGERDVLLRRYIEHMEQHQRFQQSLKEQGEAGDRLGQATLVLADSLKALEQALYRPVLALKPLIASIKACESVLAPEIVSYGHKISYTTSAPPGWVPSSVAVFKPPAPQEEQVRTGLLYSKIPDRILEYYSLEDPNKPAQPTTNAFPLQDGIPQQETTAQPVLPEMPLNVPMPPKGWKPGMPIIPLPPKGWKPGDQILSHMPLPGAVDIKMANNNEHKSDSSSSEEDMGGAGEVEWE